MQLAMATTFRLLTNARTESEQLAILRMLQAFVRRHGWELDFHLGCILAFARRLDGAPPRDVMRALVEALGVHCRGGTLQVAGSTRLLELTAGGPCTGCCNRCRVRPAARKQLHCSGGGSSGAHFDSKCHLPRAPRPWPAASTPAGACALLHFMLCDILSPRGDAAACASPCVFRAQDRRRWCRVTFRGHRPASPTSGRQVRLGSSRTADGHRRPACAALPSPGLHLLLLVLHTAHCINMLP